MTGTAPVRRAGNDVLTRRLTHSIEVVLVGLFFASLFLPLTRVLPNGLIADDGYFYLQIAYNLGHTFFSSFDGFHLTSGYHLLWGALLGLLALLLSAVTASKAWFMFASLALAAALAAYTATAFFRHTWQRLFVFAFLIWSSSMTEASLLTILVLYIFSRALNDPHEFLTAPADIIAVALIPLTRIDATIIIAVFGIFYLMTDRRKFIALCASLTVGLGLQLATMKVLFGHFFSVSSMILWNRSAGSWDLALFLQHATDNIWATSAHAVNGPSILFLVAYSWSAASSIKESDRRHRVGLIVLACSSFVIFHTLFGTMREWYWTAPLVSLFYIASELSTARSVRLLQLYCLATVGLIAMQFAALNTKYSNEQQYTRSFVDHVNHIIPPSEKVFQEDASGFVGFWSKAHVVNGDGMVNSNEYMQRLATHRLTDYLQDEDICFIIRSWPLEDDKIVAIGGLNVSTRDALLLVEPPDDAKASITQLTLYLLSEPRCRRWAYLAQARTPVTP